MTARKNCRGLSIVETMIAMMIMALMGTAIVSIITEVMSATNSARLRNQATTYSEQALEKVRDYYQLNKFTGLSTQLGCFTDGTLSTEMLLCPLLDGEGSCEDIRDNAEDIDNTPFFQVVNLTMSTYITVRSIIVYDEKGTCRKMETDTQFYNY